MTVLHQFHANKLDAQAKQTDAILAKCP